MGYLIHNIWICLALSALLGLLVGWWMWGARRARDDGTAIASDDAGDTRDTGAMAAAAGAAIGPIGPPPTPQPLPDPTPPPTEPKPEPAPTPEPVPPTEPPAPAAAGSPFLDAPIGGVADDLRRIKGIGPKLNDLLHSLGVFHFSQIAGWTAADVATVDEKLSFTGRIDREEWQTQARLLAEGRDAEHAGQYGMKGKG